MPSALHCYSLLAFDLLVDQAGLVWVLEVNPKPALHAQSSSMKAIFPVQYGVKACLLADLFSLIGLPSTKGGPMAHAAANENFGFEPLVAQAAKDVSARFSLSLVWSEVQQYLQDDILS